MNHVSIEYDIEKLIRELADTLPPNCASIDVLNDPGGNGILVSLNPVSPTAAKIVAHAKNGWGGVDLLFGRGTVFEILPRGRCYTDLPCLEEAGELCLAVVHGNFEETVWFRRSNIVVQAVGKVRVGSKMITSKYRKFFINPFISKERKHFSYTAYRCEMQ